MMNKLRTPDLFNGKTPSRFMVLVETGHPRSATPLWCTLIRQQLQYHPCIILSSGLVNYDSIKTHDPRICILHTDDFSSSTEALTALRDALSNFQPQSAYCLIEDVSWFFLDCPLDMEFEFHVRHIVSLLFDFSLHSLVARLTIFFHPIKSSLGEVISSSADICSLLELTATSIVRCGTPEFISDSGNNLIRQPVTICHKRATQSAFANPSEARLSSVSKPTLLEQFMIDMDPKVLEFVRFCQLPATDSVGGTEKQHRPQEPQPQSSFALHLTESERLARAQVVLPYELAQAKLNPTHSADDVQIHYQPDCFDDFDDEDPDDDLNI